MPEVFLKCSIGVIAYNEEGAIGACLQSLVSQKLNKVKIEEIIVIASGCTDRTEEIVSEYCSKYHFVRLVSQPKRQGKASAINLFLKEAGSGIVVESSADIVLGEEALENLVMPFSSAEIGMTGAHIIARANPDTFMGFTVKMLWELHHEVSLQTPKL
mgnify:CR=1 FL=1